MLQHEALQRIGSCPEVAKLIELERSLQADVLWAKMSLITADIAVIEAMGSMRLLGAFISIMKKLISSKFLAICTQRTNQVKLHKATRLASKLELTYASRTMRGTSYSDTKGVEAYIKQVGNKSFHMTVREYREKYYKIRNQG